MLFEFIPKEHCTTSLLGQKFSYYFLIYICYYSLLLNVDLIILIIDNVHAASTLPEGAIAYS